MPETGDVFVSAFCDSEKDRAAAKQLLRDPVEYEGVIEGYATRDAIKELTAKKIVVSVVKSEQRYGDDPLERRSKYTDPALMDRLVELDQKAAPPLPPSGGLESLGAEEPEGPQPYKVVFDGPIRPQWRDDLKALDAEIADQTQGVYRVYVDPENLEALRALPFVREAKPYELADTVSSSVLISIDDKKQQEESGFELAGAEEPEPETFDVIVGREHDLPRIVEFIKSRADAEYVEESSTAVRFKAVPDSVVLATVAKMPGVQRVVHTMQPTLYVDHARAIVGVTKINAAAPPKQWTGAGEIVAVLDSGIDATHPDFEGQLHVDPISFRNCSVVDNVGHGTHVAGIIAGTGKKSGGTIVGVAPGAKLVIVGMVNDSEIPQIPLDIGELLKVAVDAGAKIINASWGRRLGSTYDSGSRSVDKFISEHPDILVLVAAGNEGKAPDGRYEFSSIGAPATAKNVLTVGACITDRADITGTWGTVFGSLFPEPNAANDPVSGDPEKVAGISSRGPTDYDSIKPDVIAPGTYILAPRAKGFKKKLQWKAFDTTDYVYVGGTSMATPVVSGLAALLREYLRVERTTPSPSAALLKAILITATKQLPERTNDPRTKKIGYPDFDQGFGRVDISALFSGRLTFVDVPNDSPLALESRVPPGSARKSSRTYKLTVAAGAPAPLVITLAWTDPPGNDLQNNLQLDVRGGADDLLLIGNARHIFRKDPDFDDVSANGVVLDKRNNVEQIRIEAAKPGEYLVRVAAHNTTLPPQGYALAAVGNIEGELT